MRQVGQLPRNTITTDVLDTVHHLRLNIHIVLENGSASIFRQNGEKSEPTLVKSSGTASKLRPALTASKRMCISR